ncbi:MAG: hypothetical protein P4L79_10360 [Legionella sp.]|uniref:hypothetical protein n=1 Tax=Legionella sp. TaxID=459 RepID=UPI00283FE6DE|nr:hypothetical protein [Legionella sp.]
MSFADLKKNRTKLLDKVNSQFENAAKSKYQTDERFWYPTRDKAGNGLALIRFLPPVDGEDEAFIKAYDRSFKGPTGQWYIEKDLSTLGKQDPVGEFCSKLWNSGLDSDKEIAKGYKRKTYFVSNILVIKDYGEPKNDGKVFLYRYGKKLFEKLNDLMNPTFAGEAKVNPYDPWDGANLKLIVKEVEGYPNYDKSKFEDPSSLGTDDEIETIWKQEYPLLPLIDPKEFKDYAELKERFYKVLGEDTPLQSARKAGPKRQTVVEDDDTPPFETETNPKAKAPAEVRKDNVEDDDDVENYFSRLAQQED